MRNTTNSKGDLGRLLFDIGPRNWEAGEEGRRGLPYTKVD